MSKINLISEEISRYSRQLLLPQIGIKGQECLKNAKILIVGAGGLGSPVAMYAASAGVGTICLLDSDQVDLSNLQRQIIHSTKNIGRQKVESAGERLKEINPLVNIITHNAALNSKNALEIVKDYDIAIDCSDNFQTRYLLNDTCVFLGKPEVYGSVLGVKGQVSVFYAKNGPCYRCLYPSVPLNLNPNSTESGVLGVLPGIIGCIMANEAIKLITGNMSFIGKLLLFNAWDTSFKELKVERDNNCAVCGFSKLMQS